MSEGQAENAFWKIYEQVLSILPEKSNGTTNFELEKIGRKLIGPKFIGVYASDKIPRDKQGYFIVNLDKSNQKGSHWVGVVRDGDGTTVYDSFGRDTKNIFPDSWRDFGKFEEVEDDAEQHWVEANCGQLSMSWLVFFSRHGRESSKLI